MSSDRYDVAAEILAALDRLPDLAEWHVWEAQTLAAHGYELTVVEGLDRVVWRKGSRLMSTDLALSEALAIKDGGGDVGPQQA